MSDNFSDSLPKKTLDESGLNCDRAKKTVAEGNSSKVSDVPFIRKDPLEGKTIGDCDRYLLQTLLGTGGMSRVYQALDTKFEARVVAIKLMTNCSANSEHLKRFMGEIRAISRLKHPNIIQIFDFGVTPAVAPFYGVPFYVMEHLEGETLQKLLTRNKRIPINSISNIIDRVCAGLKESHQKGIVHRDLKPDNIFLVPSDTFGPIVKILDFGIAKNISINSHDRTKLTREGSFIGTYRYASPEQCRGLVDIDQRADIYSLGIILYEAICGNNPYGLDNNSHTSQIDWIAYHIVVPPKPLKQQPGCEDLADEIENIVMKCLAKSPQARFSNIEELQNAFTNISARRESDRDFQTATESEQPISTASNEEDSLIFTAGSSAPKDLKSSYSILASVNKSRLLTGAGIVSVLVSIFAGYNYISHKQFVSQGQRAVKEIEELQAAAEYSECIQQAQTFPKQYPEYLQAEVKTLLGECQQQNVTQRQQQLAETRVKAVEIEEIKELQAAAEYSECIQQAQTFPKEYPEYLQAEAKTLLGECQQQNVTQKQQPLAEARVELKSDRGIDYTLLRNYLEAGKWKEADLETQKVMLEAAEGGNLTSESIKNFSCNDLKTIDSLWLYYSGDRFGFSIQNEEYQKVKPYINTLGDKLGWRQKNWIHYNYLWQKFHPKVPKGHLPAYVYRHFYQGEERWSTQTRITGILDRTNSCNL